MTHAATLDSRIGAKAFRARDILAWRGRNVEGIRGFDQILVPDAVLQEMKRNGHPAYAIEGESADYVIVKLGGEDNMRYFLMPTASFNAPKSVLTDIYDYMDNLHYQLLNPTEKRQFGWQETRREWQEARAVAQQKAGVAAAALLILGTLTTGVASGYAYRRTHTPVSMDEVKIVFEQDQYGLQEESIDQKVDESFAEQAPLPQEDISKLIEFEKPVEKEEALKPVQELPSYITKNVETILENDSHRTKMSEDYARIMKYDATIKKAAAKYGIHPDWIRAVAIVESEGKTNPESDAGAKGLCQFMESTAKAYGLIDEKGDHRGDPIRSLYACAHYLSDLSKMGGIEGDAELVFAAYNGGPTHVRKTQKRVGEEAFSHIRKALHDETEAYVIKVMSRVAILGNHEYRSMLEKPKEQKEALKPAA